MQRRARAGLQQDLSAIAAAPFFHRRRNRAQHVDRFGFWQVFARVQQKAQRLRLQRGFGAQQREVAEWRQPGGAALREECGAQALAASRIAMFQQTAQHGVLRFVSLQNHFAGFFGTARTARHLRDQLAHAFQRAKIGAIERRIDIQDADQRQPGEVVALGQHLRADHDVNRAAADVAEQTLQFAAFAHAVGIKALDAMLGEGRAQPILHPFGSLAGRHQRFGATGPALRRHRLLRAAVMADQPAARAVQREPRVAVFARRLPAAVMTQQHRSVAAAVDENKRLPAGRKMLADGLEQRR